MTSLPALIAQLTAATEGSRELDAQIAVIALGEIVDLMIRTSRLGYTLSLGPEQMHTLIAILENARLLKASKP